MLKPLEHGDFAGLFALLILAIVGTHLEFRPKWENRWPDNVVIYYSNDPSINSTP